MIYCGVHLSVENLQHSRTYLKRHLSPVIAQSLMGEIVTRKGSRSVRLSERVVFNEKETREIVARFESIMK